MFQEKREEMARKQQGLRLQEKYNSAKLEYFKAEAVMAAAERLTTAISMWAAAAIFALLHRHIGWWGLLPAIILAYFIHRAYQEPYEDIYAKEKREFEAVELQIERFYDDDFPAEADAARLEA